MRTWVKDDVAWIKRGGETLRVILSHAHASDQSTGWVVFDDKEVYVVREDQLFRSKKEAESATR